MAGDPVADQLDVAVIATADQHPLFAADVHLPQDSGIGLLLPGLPAAPCTVRISSTRKVISWVEALPSVFSPMTSPTCSGQISPAAR